LPNYPARWHDEKERQPWLLDEVNSKHPQGVPFYWSDGKVYSLFFGNPEAIDGTQRYIYKSTDKEWKLEDIADVRDK
jgi:hypothetical protein